MLPSSTAPLSFNVHDDTANLLFSLSTTMSRQPYSLSGEVKIGNYNKTSASLSPQSTLTATLSASYVVNVDDTVTSQLSPPPPSSSSSRPDGLSFTVKGRLTTQIAPSVRRQHDVDDTTDETVTSHRRPQSVSPHCHRLDDSTTR